MAEKDDSRIADLERRVAALEAAATVAVGAPSDAMPSAVLEHGVTNRERAVDPDVFWALEGLHAREPAPGAVMIVGDVELPRGVVARWQEGARTADLLDDDWHTVADTLAALGHPVRIRLLREILRGTATARELVELDGMGTSGQVYHHLRLLVAAGWLRVRGGGTYEVPPERVVPLMTIMVGGRR